MRFYHESFGNNGLIGNGPLSSQVGFGTSGGNRFYTEAQQSMFNNPEPPVFWNLGDVEATNAALQTAVHQSEEMGKSTFDNRSSLTSDNINSKLPAALIGL